MGSQYAWLQEIPQVIVEGGSLHSSHDSAQFQSSPLFVVAGACPNSLCGMQAIMFSKVDSGVDFWWIKPKKTNPQALERETLRLHTEGEFKNSAGRSRPIYAPLAEKFTAGADGDFTFGIDDRGRAFIEEDSGNGERSRLLLYFVWQEAWSSPMAFKKFIRGKICYQKTEALTTSSSDASKGPFFCREYSIQDGQLTIAPLGNEEVVESLLPPDSFQAMNA